MPCVNTRFSFSRCTPFISPLTRVVVVIFDPPDLITLASLFETLATASGGSGASATVSETTFATGGKGDRGRGTRSAPVTDRPIERASADFSVDASRGEEDGEAKGISGLS